MKEDKYYLELEGQGFYETVDRRSKDYREYKKWKATHLKKGYKELKESVANQPEGLGDSIAKITKATGIDRAVKAVAGEDCGCDERKSKLNKLFSYKKLECISEEDYAYLNNFFSVYKGKVNHHQKVRLIEIYNFAFNQNQKTTTSCSPCISKVAKNLRKYLEV
tara:strand:- start:530 stop:1021 length:492 start_codon:yes stop_codon:yes gene_type:complete